MDWIKVKVKHAEYDFMGAPDNVFKAWIMMMILVAAIERKPLRKTLCDRLGEDNYNALEKWLVASGNSTDIIIGKVLEDVDHVNSHKQHSRKYMQQYRSKTLRKPLRGVNVNAKIREEKIREDIYKDTATPPTAVSLKLQTLLTEVYKDINIYALINKLKKDLKWATGSQFPDEVLIGVCEQYLKDKSNIKDEWGWFVSVIKAESTKYYSAQSVKQGEAFKKEPMAMSLKEIMKNI